MSKKKRRYCLIVTKKYSKAVLLSVSECRVMQTRRLGIMIHFREILRTRFLI